MNVAAKHFKEIIVFLVLFVLFYFMVFGKFESNKSFWNIAPLQSDENRKSMKDMRKPDFWLADFFGEKRNRKSSPRDIKR